MPIERKQAEEIANAAYAKYDLDKSESLDTTESRQLFKDLFAGEGIELDNAQLDLIVNAVDKNGDHKITKDELVDLLVENL